MKPWTRKTTDAINYDGEMQALFRDLAALPHMRPELRSLFAVLGNSASTIGEVRAQLLMAVDGLRDVERLVARRLKA